MRPSRPFRFDPSILSVFIAAAVVRLAVGVTVWNLPLVRTPKLDSFELLSWAQRIAAGDWTWPAVAQHGPGYPVFLAALLTLSGGSLTGAMVMQALLGAGTAVLVAMAARRLFGARASLAAGLAYALYAPAVYVDIAILSEGLLLFLLSVALWALAAEDTTRRRALVAGTAFGLAAWVRPTALIIAVASLVWLLVRRRHAAAAACAAATLLVVGPAVAKSRSATGTLSIQGYGGLNAYIGNSPLHDGRPTFRLGAGWDRLNSEAQRAGIVDPSGQDRYYLTKVRREIADRPAAFAALLGRKLMWLVQNEEVRDSHSFYFFTGQSALLRLLPRWWLLFPLAVLGAFSTWPLRRDVTIAYAVGAAIGVVALVVGFRYRMPLVPALAVLAGAGLDRLSGVVSSASPRARLVAAGVLAGALALSVMLHDPRNVNLAEEWAFTGSSLNTEPRLGEAEAAYRQALALDPQSGFAWDGFGMVLLNANRVADARSAFERAIALDSDSARALYHLALVHEREGRTAQAIDAYERSRSLSPLDSEVTQHLADARRQQASDYGMAGRTRDARDAMRQVVALTPNNGDAWLDLCLLSLDMHDVPAAQTALQRAQSLGADPAKLKFAEDALARLKGTAG